MGVNQRKRCSQVRTCRARRIEDGFERRAVLRIPIEGYLRNVGPLFQTSLHLFNNRTSIALRLPTDSPLAGLQYSDAERLLVQSLSRAVADGMPHRLAITEERAHLLVGHPTSTIRPSAKLLSSPEDENRADPPQDNQGHSHFNAHTPETMSRARPTL